MLGLVDVVSPSGQSYELNSVGDFVLALSTQTSDSFQVQVRLQPFGGSDSASLITQVAAAIGGDRVNFSVENGSPVTLDGATISLTQGSTVNLPDGGGQLLQLSANTYQLTWNTGEVLTVTNYGSYLNLSTSIPSSDSPGSVVGLMGPNGEGQASDFTLPDGTVLSQGSLTTAELYGTFANGWRVPIGFSLFDTPAPVADPNFPESQSHWPTCQQRSLPRVKQRPRLQGSPIKAP